MSKRSSPLLSIVASGPLAPDDSIGTLEVGGRSRSYIIHVPPKHYAKHRTPVVLIFHGAGSNGEQMVRFCGLGETADLIR